MRRVAARLELVVRPKNRRKISGSRTSRTARPFERFAERLGRNRYGFEFGGARGSHGRPDAAIRSNAAARARAAASASRWRVPSTTRRSASESASEGSSSHSIAPGGEAVRRVGAMAKGAERRLMPASSARRECDGAKSGRGCGQFPRRRAQRALVHAEPADAFPRSARQLPSAESLGHRVELHELALLHVHRSPCVMRTCTRPRSGSSTPQRTMRRRPVPQLLARQIVDHERRCRPTHSGPSPGSRRRRSTVGSARMSA